MLKTLLLCEKPSVAMDFARALGQFQKHDGYLENGQYIITWAYGHLCELKEPEDYNPDLKKWDLQSLPIFPQRFEYKVIQSGEKQFRVIKTLLHRGDVSQVVIATDCGREGELIARLILLQSGWKNWDKTYRFWTSEALTPQVIKSTMQNLKSVKEFDRLYQSALARQWADWLVGINCTRAVTCKNRELFSVGRVQTAVLALIVKREKERRDFKPQTYYNVFAMFVPENCNNNSGGDDGNFIVARNKSNGGNENDFGLHLGEDNNVFKGIYFKKVKSNGNEEDVENENPEDINSKYAIKEKAIADRIVADVEGQKGIVQKVVTKISQDPPPLLFSLTTLQQEANRLFGLSAEQTLQIAQSLYEKHLISYPRTESQYLSPNYANKCKDILRTLTKTWVTFDLDNCHVNSGNKRIFDISKLTDHHALIPQGVPSGELSELEKKIYTLICKRFISAFYPDCKVKNTILHIQVGGHWFEVKGKVLLDAGWKSVYGGVGKEVILPDVKKGEVVFVTNSFAEEKQTQPPPRYTDATLLGVMANAHKVVTDERLKAILKENAGIGTPATRAKIIETLVERKYVVKQGKYYAPTQKGEFLIKLLDGERITSPEYTALWEQELERIAKGEKTGAEGFLVEIKDYVKYFIEKIKNNSAVFSNKSLNSEITAPTKVQKVQKIQEAQNQTVKVNATELNSSNSNSSYLKKSSYEFYVDKKDIGKNFNKNYQKSSQKNYRKSNKQKVKKSFKFKKF